MIEFNERKKWLDGPTRRLDIALAFRPGTVLLFAVVQLEQTK
jgi:hypothetical protein